VTRTFTVRVVGPSPPLNGTSTGPTVNGGWGWDVGVVVFVVAVRDEDALAGGDETAGSRAIAPPNAGNPARCPMSALFPEPCVPTTPTTVKSALSLRT